MKKKLFNIVFVMTIIACLSIAPAQAITISISDSYIQVGESFDVTISAYDDGTLGDLASFGLWVDHPISSSAFYFFDGYTIGNGFDDVSSGAYIAGLYTGLGNSGTNVELAIISCTAGPNVAIDHFTIYAEPSYGPDYGLYYEFGEVEHIFSAAEITINPIPEPGTMLLVAFGIVGIGIFGAKKKRV